MKKFRMSAFKFEWLLDGYVVDILPSSLGIGEKIQIFHYDENSAQYITQSVIARVELRNHKKGKDGYSTTFLSRLAKVVYKSGDLAQKDYEKL